MPWVSVADNWQFQPGQRVRVLLTFSALPGTAPDATDYGNVFGNLAGLNFVSASETLTSRGIGITDFLTAGATQKDMDIDFTVAGLDQFSQVPTAGMIRANMMNGISVLNNNRTTPLWNMAVGDIMRDESFGEAVSDVLGISSGSQQSSDPSGFAWTTTIVVVFVVIGLIALAYVIHPLER